MKLAQMTLDKHLAADSPIYTAYGVKYDLEYYPRPDGFYTAVIVNAFNAKGHMWEATVAMTMKDRVIDVVRCARSAAYARSQWS